jgi:Na+/proline symporter
MGGCIILAWLVLDAEKIGGMSGLMEKLPQGSFQFFPKISFSEGTAQGSVVQMSLGLMTFLSFVGLQWWASWYPGAEPGGGGYVAQRMMSTRTENDAFKATLLFQIAHYALRPWPWIIVALASVVLYPELSLENKKLGYVMAMKEFLPNGLKGLMLAAFLAAYMSTISTQLNWGASYLMNDLYLRFINPTANAKKSVFAARVATVLIMLFGLAITTQVKTLSNAFAFMIESGAGLGAVLILRWYWWRINAVSEITATIAPFFGYALAIFVFDLTSPYSMFFTTGFTTVAWLVATFLTKPEPQDVLVKFYEKIEPLGFWKPIALQSKTGIIKNNIGKLFLGWFFGVVTGYAVLFLIGDLLFKNYQTAGLDFLALLIGIFVLRWAIK